MIMMIIIKAFYDVCMLRKLATRGAKRIAYYTRLQEFNTKKVITS